MALIGGTFYSTSGLDLELRFEGEDFDERGLAALRFIPGLARLRISPRNYDLKLSQRGIDLIAALPHLTAVDFGGNLALDTMDLTPLTKLMKLERLSFSRSASLEDRHLRMLEGLTSLKDFSCYGAGTTITDDGVRALKNNRGLEILKIHEHQATGSFLSAFTDCPLSQLTLSAAAHDKSSMSDAEAGVLLNFPHLTQLELQNEIQLGHASLQHIGQLKQLHRLNLNGCRGLPSTAFSILKNLTALQSISLKDTAFGDDGITAIRQLPRLENLSMGHQSITNEGLSTLQQLYSIQRLQIETMSADDEGLRYLGRINRLRTLEIGGPNITGSGLGPLCKLPELNDLKLRCPQLTNVAFEHLSESTQPAQN